MKPLYLTLVLSTLLFACKKEDPVCDIGPRYIRVDFQSSFQEDTVGLFLGNSPMMQDAVLTTDLATDLAGTKDTGLFRRGIHTLKVVVNNRDSASVPLQLDELRDWYVGVGYMQGKVTFNLRKEPFQ